MEEKKRDSEFYTRQGIQATYSNCISAIQIWILFVYNTYVRNISPQNPLISYQN